MGSHELRTHLDDGYFARNPGSPPPDIVENGTGFEYALPFGFSNRTVWYISFTTVSAVLFAVPFINTEIKVGPLRAAARAKKE
ncbi:hypothetical protein HDU76_012661 [Blyttiomyces sp. JEL0837]|nr:hypothetical protein HDU76_012661 [Blyttiomyces sp. JEL0837]